MTNWNEWVRANWFTVMGIIIILCVTWYDVSQSPARVKSTVDECNMFWQKQVELACPVLADGTFDYGKALQDMPINITLH